MWSKTLIGIIVSLLLSMSLMLNIAYLSPLPRDVYLLLGFVGGILLWAVIMTIFYCADSVKRLLFFSGPILVVSMVVNGVFIAGLL